MADSILLYPWGQSYNQVDSTLIETYPKLQTRLSGKAIRIRKFIVYQWDLSKTWNENTLQLLRREGFVWSFKLSNPYSQIEKVVKFGNGHALRLCLL